MISDSIANASIHMASSNPKDFAKKKKANRSAKLKQCKLDARREQWLSQVKNKGNCKEESNGGGIHGGSSVKLENKSVLAIEKLEIKPRDVQENYGDGSQLHHYSDSESSPSTSHTSSVLGNSDSRTNFTGSSSRSSSASSNGCCSGSMSEEDEGDDDSCLDDWEAVADALAATDDKQRQQNTESGLDLLPSEKDLNASQSDSQSKVRNQSGFALDISKPKPDNRGMAAEGVLGDILIVEALFGHVRMLCPSLHRAQYAMRILTSRTPVFSLVHVASGSAFSVTRGFLRRMAVVQVAGSSMTLKLLMERQHRTEAA
ncbi:unnamed protein product [Fraxinus pennsylvanica]|uniref:Uncharacterized protein n=1 Tax=Fraxinus pennsylvanica TaxID=56036 RepID=A0AAD1ZQD3_9LAMI|nr:unnamed protein product [Fraxinus pennsylvanica]